MEPTQQHEIYYPIPTEENQTIPNMKKLIAQASSIIKLDQMQYLIYHEVLKRMHPEQYEFYPILTLLVIAYCVKVSIFMWDL